MRVWLVALVLASAPLLGVAVADHPQTTGTHTVSFDHKAGNEWWVEVALGGASAGQATGVESRDDGGAWVTLTKRSWGAWAASYHVEPGHRVQFRAHFAGGAIVESCWFTHPAGAEQCATQPDPDPDPQPGAFTFDHKAGNEWWVEVAVAPRPVAVEAMDTGGAWKALTLRSWGNWAGSFQIEPGHEVKFRARGADGLWSESCWSSHPAGVERCEGGGGGGGGGGTTPGNATFDHKAGNEWWVEVAVKPEPTTVQAMDTGGAWVTLTKRSWGNWAGSFRIEAGHEVRFRAQDATGAWQESCWFSHPAGVERCETATTWPREGSYVRYFLDSGTSVPGYSDDQLVWLNYTYSGGRWRGTCEGWELTWSDYGGDERTRINTTAATSPPPLGNPRTVQPGQSVEPTIPECHARKTFAYVDERTTTEGYHGTEPFKKNGVPVVVPVWVATYEEDGCPCEWRGVAWHPDTGLTIDYVHGYRYSSESGHLVDTDAPISRADTADPPVPAWPKEGSFARYQVNLSSEYSDVVEQVAVSFVYVGGAWQATCTGREGVVQSAPPMAPTTTQSGALVRPTETHVCNISPPAVVVQGRFPQDTTRNGAFHRATVWWGDESPDTYGDEDAWWDVATGLLLKWEDHGGYFQGDEGYLVDTDAPLSRG